MVGRNIVKQMDYKTLAPNKTKREFFNILLETYKYDEANWILDCIYAELSLEYLNFEIKNNVAYLVSSKEVDEVFVLNHYFGKRIVIKEKAFYDNKCNHYYFDTDVKIEQGIMNKTQMVVIEHYLNIDIEDYSNKIICAFDHYINDRIDYYKALYLSCELYSLCPDNHYVNAFSYIYSVLNLEFDMVSFIELLKIVPFKNNEAHYLLSALYHLLILASLEDFLSISTRHNLLYSSIISCVYFIYNQNRNLNTDILNQYLDFYKEECRYYQKIDDNLLALSLHSLGIILTFYKSIDYIYFFKSYIEKAQTSCLKDILMSIESIKERL